MSGGQLGREYADGETIVRQGETGDCMYVVQEGRVGIYVETDGKETLLREVDEEDAVIGEMALFGRQVRSATVRAHGRVRVLTIDRSGFLRRVHEDPSIAFRIVRTLSERVRILTDEVTRLKEELGRRERE